MSGYAKMSYGFSQRQCTQDELSFLKILTIYFSINDLLYLYTLCNFQALEQSKCVPLTLLPALLLHLSTLDECMSRCIKKWPSVCTSGVMVNRSYSIWRLMTNHIPGPFPLTHCPCAVLNFADDAKLKGW